MSLDISSEIMTDKGRIDIVISTDKYVYIFEIKFNKTAELALKQIMERKYYERFLLCKKQIVLVGVSFNRSKNKFSLEYDARLL